MSKKLHLLLSALLVLVNISVHGKTVQILVGSTREGRTSLKLAQAIQNLAPKTNTQIELVDLKDFKLPFLYESEAPAQTKTRKDPAIAKWSKKILTADGLIILVPEYNGSFPGVLKNAIDVLFYEWQNKPALLVSYSGGPNGGANALQHLTKVAETVGLKVLPETIKIPSAWKALDAQGTFTDKKLAQNISTAVKNLLTKI